MGRYFTIKDEDLDFNVEEEFTRMIRWELWDKMTINLISAIKVNPIKVDTLYDYMKMLVPSTIEVERTLYGCKLNTKDSIYVIITPDDITVRSFEPLPLNSFMFDILKPTGEYTNSGKYEWEYQFELLEVLKDEPRDLV